jgi:hypothetical protein
VDGDLIVAYLVELGHGLPGRQDVDDVLAEVEDHLRQKASQLEASGLDPDAAQREAVEAFGDPVVVARAFTTVPTVPGAVATRFTRFSGVVAIAAGLAWVSLVGTIVFFAMMIVSASAIRTFAIGAVVLTVVALVGSVRRAGGFRNVVIGVVFGCVAALALPLAASLSPWTANAGYLSLLGVVTVLTIVAVRGSRTRQFGRGWWAFVFQGAWLPHMVVTAAFTWSHLWVFQVLGWTIDLGRLVHGDGPAVGVTMWAVLANYAAVGFGIAVFAGGLIRLGLTLFREPIADVDPVPLRGA